MDVLGGMNLHRGNWGRLDVAAQERAGGVANAVNVQVGIDGERGAGLVPFVIQLDDADVALQSKVVFIEQVLQFGDEFGHDNYGFCGVIFALAAIRSEFLLNAYAPA